MSLHAFSQITEDFSDGDFASNPAWSGDITAFEIESGQLHSYGPDITETLHLSTPNTVMDYTEWTFLVDMRLAPSGSNKSRIYLVSDESNLEGELKGYYIQIGQSGEDEIDFYRQDGSSSSLLFSGSTKFSGEVLARIKVMRDALGTWSVWCDPMGGTAFVSEGDEFVDNTYAATAYFGFVVFHTKTNRYNFYFDDVGVSAFDPPFGLASVDVEGSQSLRLHFTQGLDATSAESVGNYTLSNGYATPSSALMDASNPDQVLLTFADDFSNNDYILTINNISNVDQDETLSEVEQPISIETATAFRDIVINEIYADFNPSATGLPDEEFIELLNTSDQAIKVENFTLNGNALEGFTLESGAYVIVTDDSNLTEFEDFGDVVTVASFPALTNGGMRLTLLDNLGNVVDSLTYSTRWYHDETKDDGGFSLEQINPYLACNYSANWTASRHMDGGSPGQQNSVLDDSPDTTSPNLIALDIIDERSLELTFDEPMDEQSLSMATYALNQGSTIGSVSPSYFGATLGVMPSLVSGTTYTLTIAGAEDCAGNELEVNMLSETYDVEPPVLEEVIVVSDTELQLVFDEELDLEGVSEDNFVATFGIGSPSVLSQDDRTPTVVHLHFEAPFVPDLTYDVTAHGLSDLAGNVSADSYDRTFSYRASLDTVWVLGGHHLLLAFEFPLQRESMLDPSHYGLGGEELGPISVFANKNDTLQVHLIFQTSLDENKLLTLYAEGLVDEEGESLPRSSATLVYDTAPPKVDTLEVLDERTLLCRFTEKVEQQSAVTLDHYEYEDHYPDYAELDTAMKTVRLEFDEVFESEVIYDLLIDQVADQFDNVIKTRIRRSFVYDEVPPQLDSAYVKSPSEIVLLFHEPLDTALAAVVDHYHLEALGLVPSKAVVEREFARQVTLYFAEETFNSEVYELGVAGLADQRGNTMTDPLMLALDHGPFRLSGVEVLAADEVRLEFNQVLGTSFDEPLHFDLVALDVDSVASVGRFVTLYLSGGMEAGTSYELLFSALRSVEGQVLQTGSCQFVFDPRLENAVIQNNHTIALTFETTFDAVSQEDFWLNADIQPVAVVVSSEDSHVLQLVFEEEFRADQLYLIGWSVLQNQFGNLMPGHSVAVKIDRRAPTVETVRLLDAETLSIHFSEPMDESAAEFLGYYESSELAWGQATYLAQDTAVILTLGSPIGEQEYSLMIHSLHDLSQNQIKDTTVNFSYEMPYLPQYGELIITEIMAAPTADQEEYIELYNASEQSLKLTGLVWKDGNGQTTFESGEVEPGEYILLAAKPSSFLAQNVGSLSSWLTLNNGGETLSIYAGDELVFSTSYTDDWYGVEEHTGLSLEMVDVANFCGEERNWTGSQEIGGTPGMANSQSAENPDHRGPEIVSAVWEGNQQIEITWDEKLYPTMGGLLEYMVFDPNRVIESAELVLPGSRSMTVTLLEELQPRQQYALTVSGVKDCVGNLVSLEAGQIIVQVPELADSLDVLINEVLFNPESGGVDFVEIYNHSDKVIDLQNWVLASGSGEGITSKVITTDHRLVEPSTFVVLTADPLVLAAQYPSGDESAYFEMASFPAYNDGDGEVTLIDAVGQTVDYFAYREDYHSRLLDSEEGVSLERIAYDAPSNDPNSWHSAASTAFYATPGRQNSQYTEAGAGQGQLVVEPKVFMPNTMGQPDFTTIRYVLDQPGGFANISVFDTHGRPIRALAENQLLSMTGFVTWDGTTDAGDLAPIGYYIVFAEVYDPSGNKQVIKETVVLGGEL
ncbi:hypothetical protein BFP72_16795 [Reichenbachiella sp. 5M10]|nr:hypothetical protein BFP72_16795 [Reichenbachiella sp. 5M10]